jgi:hypothetical protein
MDSIFMDALVEDAAGEHLATCEPGCPTVVAGRLATALEFNTGPQITQHLDITADGPFSNLVTFSATAWIDPTSLTDEACVFSKPYLGGDANSWQLCINGGALEFFTFGAGGQMRLDTDPILSVDHLWHHVAIVYDGTTKSIWLDGAPLKTADAPHPTVDGHDVIIAGDVDMIATVPMVIAPFIGGLDDIRFYAYGLYPEEVAALAAGVE